MNIVLWVLQGLLGAAFVGAGLMKVTQPKEKMPAAMTWTQRRSANTIKFIGVMEILGGLGLILPWATGIAKILTPLAALGLAIIMAGAVWTHAKRKEPWIPQLVLLILTLVVAIVRF